MGLKLAHPLLCLTTDQSNEGVNVATYLVTGGCGFIGSHLCDALVEAGHRVVVLDNLSTGKLENLPADAEFVSGDICDQRLVKQLMSDVDGCFHLAAIASVQSSIEDWTQCHRVNLTGAINVFDAARASRRGAVPVVYASSAAVYGDNASVPLSESERPSPLTPYGADKLGCELHARVATLIHRVPTTGFRFFNVYGTRQDPDSPYSGVISLFINRLSQGLPLTIFGDGKQARDFIFVGDVVGFMIRAMLNPATQSRVLNACTGSMVTITELAKTLAAITGSNLEIDYRPARAGDIRISLGNPRKALKELNIGPSISLAEGLQMTLSAAAVIAPDGCVDHPRVIQRTA